MNSPVRGMQVFDEASRGPLGALKLLFSRQVLSLGSLGALIILLSLAMDPFFQQLVSYPLESRTLDFSPAQQSQASLYKASHYDERTATDRIGFPSAERAMQQAVYGSLFLGSQKTTTAVCSSGNCTWPLFHSLGICNQCKDVSSLIVKGSEPNPDWTIAHEHTALHTQAYYSLPNGLNVSLSDKVLDYEPAIVSASGNIVLTQIPLTNFTIANISAMSIQAAYECNIHWVRTFSATSLFLMLSVVRGHKATFGVPSLRTSGIIHATCQLSDSIPLLKCDIATPMRNTVVRSICSS